MALPSNWIQTTLGEATRPIQKRVNPQDYPELPYIGMENIEPHTMRLLGTVPAKNMRSTAETFTSGDVLYGRLRPYLNKVYCPEFDGLCSTEFIVFRKLPHLHSKYFQHFLNSWTFATYANSLNAGDRPRVKFEQLAEYPFPLPPLPEQERIVSRIESLFTQLDAGVAGLKRAQAALKRYRASVLKAACEGRLVPQDPNDEPAVELLKRILAEKGEKVDKIPVPNGDLPELPPGWMLARLNDLTIKITDGTHFTPTYINDGVAFISVKDIYGRQIHFDNCKYIPQAEHDQLIKRCHPEPLDILITKSGTIGRIAVVKTDRPFSLFVSVALIKPVRAAWDSDYLAVALENYVNHLDIQQDVKGGVIKNLHVEDIKEITLPLPPYREQQRIVYDIERRLSVVAELEQAVSASLVRAARLRQAILKRAFEGRLVEQNPEDEPMEALIERIKADTKPVSEKKPMQARLF